MASRPAVKVAVVHLSTGEKFTGGDDWEIDDHGALKVWAGGDPVAYFQQESWEWVELRDREPTHRRRERTSSEEAVVPIRQQQRPS